MNQTVLDDGTETIVYYSLKVGGVVYPNRYESKSLAEQYKMSLPPDKQFVTEIVPTTVSGKELLLG